MHNNIQLMAPTSLCNPTKLELCTTPHPEWALDKWMGQNSPFYTPITQPFNSALGPIEVHNLAYVMLKCHLIKPYIIV